MTTMFSKYEARARTFMCVLTAVASVALLIARPLAACLWEAGITHYLEYDFVTRHPAGMPMPTTATRARSNDSACATRIFSSDLRRTFRICLNDPFPAAPEDDIRESMLIAVATN